MEKQENKTVKSLCIGDLLYYSDYSGVEYHIVTGLDKSRTGGMKVNYNTHNTIEIPNTTVTSFENGYGEILFVNFSKADERRRQLIKEKYATLLDAVNKASNSLNEFVNTYILTEIK